MIKQLASLKILIVDDDAAVARLTTRQLTQRDCAITCIVANSQEQALALLSQHPAVAIVDLSLNDELGPESGFRLIDTLLAHDPTLRIIVQTGHESADFGIRALQHGAASFVSKPANPDHLYALVKDALQTYSLNHQYQQMLAEKEQSYAVSGLVTQSQQMAPVLEAIHYSAQNNLPVLILGETGVGKGLVARAVHKLSQRQARPFVRVQPNFANFDLLSCELFGHEKGAFTGATAERIGLIEDANTGTLFIDEVAELSQDVQLMLLETLQEKSFRRIGSSKSKKTDFRLISATNVALADLQASDKLRSDFFHRIAHSKIEIPPLRQRPEDIALLAKYFLEKLQIQEDIAIQDFSPQALSTLQNYRWPGNVRELQAVVEAACYRADFRKKRKVDATDIEFIEVASAAVANGSFRQQVQNYEEKLVNEALAHFDGNQSKAAESLQLDRTSFRRILNR